MSSNNGFMRGFLSKCAANIFTALEIGRYLTLGACKTMEDWVKYGTLVGGVGAGAEGTPEFTPDIRAFT